MNISPKKELGEPDSSYRFRMLIFCLYCFAFFGLLLIAMLTFRPEVSNAEYPLIVMFLWFGIPMSFGASVLATVGYLIGALFSIFLESSKMANSLWPYVKTILLSILLLPLFLFALYWFMYGLYNMEVLPFAKQTSYKLIGSQEDPFLFWFSILMWGALGTWGPYSMMKSALKYLERQTS